MQTDNLFSRLAGSFGPQRRKTAVEEGNVRTSYGELRQLIDRYSVRLCRDTRRGDVVGVQCSAKTHALAALYACFRTGRTAVCLLTRDRKSNDHAIADAGVSLVLNDVDSEAVSRVDAETSAHDPAIVIYTSGTTAEYRKGVLVSHHCIADAATFMNRTMRVTDEISEILVAPIDHLYGLGRCHAVLSAGGTLTVTSNIVTVFDTMARGGNSFGIVPSVIAAMLADHEGRLREIGQNLKWMQTGAMRIDQRYRRKLLEVFPRAGIFMHYGLSEVMRATFLDLREEQHKIHTEGRPRPGVKLEISDHEGTTLPACREGEICISGDALAMGYTDPGAWQARMRGGRYRTGDIGLLDDDGYLVFRGRNDDILNVNGNLVHPAEIESRLSGLVAAPICVVGLSDPRGVRDKVLVLCVEGETGISKRQVAAHLAGSERHLVPDYVKTVQQFPRTVTGKIKRHELSALIADL